MEGLTGRLKEDFNKLLDNAVDEKLKQERSALTNKIEKHLQTEFDTKHSELSMPFETVINVGKGE